MAEHMITNGITELYLGHLHGRLSGGEDTLYLIDDEDHDFAGLVLEPLTGYTGLGKVYVGSCFPVFSDEYIIYLDNYDLWENILAWSVYCPGDVDRDGARNFTDLTLFATSYSSQAGDPAFLPHCDMDDDGVINFTDFNYFASNYGVPCP